MAKTASSKKWRQRVRLEARYRKNETKGGDVEAQPNERVSGVERRNKLNRMRASASRSRVVESWTTRHEQVVGPPMPD